MGCANYGVSCAIKFIVNCFLNYANYFFLIFFFTLSNRPKAFVGSSSGLEKLDLEEVSANGLMEDEVKLLKRNVKLKQKIEILSGEVSLNSKKEKWMMLVVGIYLCCIFSVVKQFLE